MPPTLRETSSLSPLSGFGSCFALLRCGESVNQGLHKSRQPIDRYSSSNKRPSVPSVLLEDSADNAVGSL